MAVSAATGSKHRSLPPTGDSGVFIRPRLMGGAGGPVVRARWQQQLEASLIRCWAGWRWDRGGVTPIRDGAGVFNEQGGEGGMKGLPITLGCFVLITTWCCKEPG